MKLYCLLYVPNVLREETKEAKSIDAMRRNADSPVPMPFLKNRESWVGSDYFGESHVGFYKRLYNVFLYFSRYKYIESVDESSGKSIKSYVQSYTCTIEIRCMKWYIDCHKGK